MTGQPSKRNSGCKGRVEGGGAGGGGVTMVRLREGDEAVDKKRFSGQR